MAAETPHECESSYHYYSLFIILSIITIYCVFQGSELMSRLSLPKGPVVGQVAEEQISWQIRTKCESVDECVAYLQTVFKQGGERV